LCWCWCKEIGTSSLDLAQLTWVGSSRRRRQNPVFETLCILNKNRRIGNVQTQYCGRKSLLVNMRSYHDVWLKRLREFTESLSRNIPSSAWNLKVGFS
jgi:hypothetical protein